MLVRSNPLLVAVIVVEFVSSMYASGVLELLAPKNRSSVLLVFTAEIVAVAELTEVEIVITPRCIDFIVAPPPKN